jgi:hypothetical protein
MRMIIHFKLLKNSVKNLVRDIKFDLTLALRFLLVLSIFYLFFFLFYLGLNIDQIFQIYKPHLNPVEGFNSILFYLFLIGMLFIYFFQKSAVNEVVSYLHLPINRNKIIIYILGKSFFNFYSLGFLFLFIPFSITSVYPRYGLGSFIHYLTAVLLIMIFVVYLTLFVKNIVRISYIYAIIPFVLISMVFILKIVFSFQFEKYSMWFFQCILYGNKFLILFIFISLIGVLFFNFLYFRRTFYWINAENLPPFKLADDLSNKIFASRNNKYFLLELRLIIRNKRINALFISAIGFILLFYNLLYNNQSGVIFSLMIYIILNGIFGYLFLQYLFSWESSYFDLLFATKFDFVKYLKAKYFIYVFAGLLVFIFFIPLTFNNKIDFHLFLTAFLFNSSIGYFILFFTATFNSSRINLNSSIFFNLQGWNNTQVLAMGIIIFSPVILMKGLTLIFNVLHSLYIINIICAISLICQKKWFSVIYNQLLKRKYINLKGYRE